MKEIRVTTWNDLTDALYESSWQPSLGRFRSNWVYRGGGDASDDLKTALMRLGGDYASVEAHLLRNFRKYASASDRPTDSAWHCLALAQHHGLPTRLQDWTFSPFVAMHFATDDPGTSDRDGAVWAIDHTKTNLYLPARLKQILDEHEADVFTAEMLSSAACTLEEFDALGGPYLLFFEPPSLDARIVNQYALFVLITGATMSPGEWLAAHPEAARKIVIPAALKLQVRDMLDQANITERVLFPGLDGLARWLRRYYTPRPNNDRRD
ncbi:MAG: FRG domain-containing protein [Rudaea sp.]